MSELGLALMRIRNKLRRDQQYLRHRKRQEMFIKKRPNFYLEEAETAVLSHSKMTKLLELLSYSKIDASLLKVIRRNLEQNQNYINILMRIPGTLDRLVMCLKDSDVEKLLEAIGCLTNLCLDSHQTTLKIIEKAAPYLITFLHSTSHILKEYCFICLGNMASDCCICCKFLINQGIIFPMIKSLECSYSNVIASSLYALKHFSRHHSEENTVELINHGLLPILSRVLFLKEIDTNILADAYSVLFHVSAHIQVSGTEFYKESIHHTALNHLGQYCQEQPLNINVIIPIIRCLGNLSSFNDLFSNEIFCHPCFEISLTILLYSSFCHVRKEVIWLFNNIIASCKSELLWERISVSSVINAFLLSVQTGNSSLTEVLLLLCSLVSKKQEISNKLLECGLLIRLNDLKHCNEEQVLLSNILISYLLNDNR